MFDNSLSDPVDRTFPNRFKHKTTKVQVQKTYQNLVTLVDLVLLFLLCNSLGLQAQDPLVIDNNGVNINGPLTITNQGNGEVLLNLNSDKSWQFKQNGTGAGARLKLYNGSGKDFLFTTTGSIGIGGHASGYKLNVAGASTIDNVFIGNANSSASASVRHKDSSAPALLSHRDGTYSYLRITTKTAKGYIGFQVVDDGDTKTPMVVSSNGNVGIGTRSPTKGKLEIVGAAGSNSLSYGYLNNYKPTGKSSGTNLSYSLYADGRIASTEFVYSLALRACRSRSREHKPTLPCCFIPTHGTCGRA